MPPTTCSTSAPVAGEHGGHVVAQGTAEEVAAVRRFARPGSSWPARGGSRCRRSGASPRGYIEIKGAAEHNLKGIDVKVPLGVLCSVTGVSGSGKSTLVNEVLFKAVANRLRATRARAGAHKSISGLDQLDKIISVDQSPIGRTPRSNPATYIGLFDQIRDLFARTPEAQGARVQAGPLLVQRQGRALRGLQGRRPDQDRDALPAGRVRAVRAVPRQALQPGDARGPLQGQDDRRRAGDADRRGARVLRAHPEDQPACADAV